MLVVYAGVIAFGLNEFRKTPIGFIPQLDRGYLIIVTQLPPAASLARTDEVNRRAVEIALKVPGVAHAVNIVGFSGATFTNAPNAGAIFVMLDPFEKRAKDPQQSAAAIQGQLFSACGDPGRLDLRCRAAAGVRHRQCRRLPHDGGGPRRARLAGAAGRGLRHDGAGGADAGARPGLSRCSRTRRRSSISTSTAPRRSCSASIFPTCSPRCRSISARPTSTTSICSAAPSAWSRRRRATTAPTPRTC